MNKKYLRIVALAAVAFLVAGACASEDEGDESGSGSDSDGGTSEVVACQVTDTGGVDDRSFNQTANEGLVRAEEELGVEGNVLESQSEADFEPNLKAFVDQDCDLIIPVGFLLDSATQASAKDNPDQKYAIVDVDFFDTEAGEDITLDNVEELTFATDQAAFLAGYLAAGSTETGTVGTYGGINIPTVTIFMDGFLAGVQQYNADNGTDVKVLGWDGSEGLFTGDFEDQDKGKQTTKSLIDEGADIVMPVAGPVGLGSVEAANEADGVKLIWVDTDGCVSVPDACDLFLTSVQKKMDVAVYDSIKSVVDGEFEAGLYVGTLENDGVGIPELGSDVPEELAQKIDEYREAIISGDQSTSPS
ncbi:MAG: BMP family ABC transporter substrate-binding protein [Microthrixaceae bacterium]|nr:BMP family ABC transporter substrate-binding protein [Microthrixaceae bacterium]MCO5317035.1 BMP family ABC transporter substrate-binding protein [Microthrixaceae bacterium]